MKEVCWLFISQLKNPDIPFVIPTVAWIAKEKGVRFECYLECKRDGMLFAQTGSTVIGGHHFQQFNYINNVFDVKYILYGGEAPVFRSSIERFGKEILAKENTPEKLYRSLLGEEYEPGRAKIYGQLKKENKNFAPYVYPEIFFDRLFAYHDESFADPLVGDSYTEMTSAISDRYADQAKGVAFGDPDAILSMLPLLCREEKVALYGEVQLVPKDKLVFSQYAEMTSKADKKVCELAKKTGNKVIVGRQTGDGDLFEWAKSGVCIQIMDPNRPAFPVVKEIEHPWFSIGKTYSDCEPDDDTLKRYAAEGKTLASILIHSGEMAHNEAVIQFMDYINTRDVKFGFGVHAARYETCPQFWELLGVPRENGGFLGAAEPLLHAGGMGIMAEINCPTEDFKAHMDEAMSRIRKIAPECIPKGYYAFCDTDLKTLSAIRPELYEAMKEEGLEYCISSAMPGSNKTIYRADGFSVLNQSECRHLDSSPFLRFPDVERMEKEHDWDHPGWFFGVLDAPVVAFTPYMWSDGQKFDRLTEFLTTHEKIVPALPHTVYRYAKILGK